MKKFRFALLALLPLAASAVAADFDGSKKLICAPYTAMDCAEGVGCVSGTPAEMGAPAFIRVDVAKKEVSGTERTSPILEIVRTEQQLLLQGVELDQAWAIAVSTASGGMYATITGHGGAIVMVGNCTPI